MAKNLMGKSRKPGNAYLVIIAGSWRWEILKMNGSLEKAMSNPYASAFCAVSSPNTFGSFDYGDTYLSDIAAGAGISKLDLVRMLEVEAKKLAAPAVPS